MPETKMAAMANRTKPKKRPSTAASSGSRCGGGNCAAATGRRQKWAKNMPPTQTMTPDR